MVDVSVVFMPPYYLDPTNEAIFSLIPSRTTWCIHQMRQKGVEFCDNWIMFQLLKDLNNVKYVHLVKGLYCSCSSYGIPDIKNLSIFYAHATQAHCIRQIARTTFTSLGSKHR